MHKSFTGVLPGLDENRVNLQRTVRGKPKINKVSAVLASNRLSATAEDRDFLPYDKAPQPSLGNVEYAVKGVNDLAANGGGHIRVITEMGRLENCRFEPAPVHETPEC